MEVHPLKLILSTYYSLCSVTGPTVEIMQSEEIEPGIIFSLTVSQSLFLLFLACLA